MNPQLYEHYKNKILPNIEEPIREIIDALWQLPFVVDTSESCCGHIVTNDWDRSAAEYEPLRQGLYWYPHGIRLGIDFSLEEELKQKVDAFKSDISAILPSINTTFSLFEQKYRTLDGNILNVARATYYGNFPPRDFIPPVTHVDEFIHATQSRLIGFWESFAQIVREYNPSASISPIADKNFNQIIDWVDLGEPGRYLS